MFMRVSRFVAVLSLLAIVLASCAPPPAPTTVVQPTTNAAPSEAPTETEVAAT